MDSGSFLQLPVPYLASRGRRPQLYVSRGERRDGSRRGETLLISPASPDRCSVKWKIVAMPTSVSSRGFLPALLLSPSSIDQSATGVAPPENLPVIVYCGPFPSPRPAPPSHMAPTHTTIMQGNHTLHSSSSHHKLLPQLPLPIPHPRRVNLLPPFLPHPPHHRGPTAVNCRQGRNPKEERGREREKEREKERKRERV